MLIFVLILICISWTAFCLFLNQPIAEGSDLLQKLSLDSQPKKDDAVEATKKVNNFTTEFLVTCHKSRIDLCNC